MLTVLIATRNGAKTLPAVLETYGTLESPPGGWKIVLVDNGSTDGSREIIGSFQDRLPLTYVFEPRPGKNAALNSGLPFVAGDLVVLTDDDIFPRPDWLVRLREAADARPAFGVFGGRVFPRWETSPPAWLLKWAYAQPTYAISNASLTEGPTDGHLVFGGNMAVRAEIFGAGHRFDPSLGPTSGRSYPMGSETELTLRLMKEGVKAWFAPAASVEHFVRTSQMQRSWVIRRAERFGRGQCRLGLQNPPFPRFRWLGIPLYLFYQIARKSLGVVLALLLFDREKVFRRSWALRYFYGYALEARACSKR